MRLHLADGTVVGQALDLREADIPVRAHPNTSGQDPVVSRLEAAVEDPADPLLDCTSPSPVHRAVGVVQEGMSVDRRRTLLEAARSIGLEPPQADVIADLEARIEAISPEDPDLRATRKRAAEAAASVDALRERVARLSGRLEAAREADQETEELEAALAEATRELTEAETEAAAARQALEAAEERAARGRRAERLSLVDRRENRRREAREWLIEAAERRLETALASLPLSVPGQGTQTVGEGASHRVALGILRVARVRAPVVLVDSPFDCPLRARAALAAPVVLV